MFSARRITRRNRPPSATAERGRMNIRPQGVQAGLQRRFLAKVKASLLGGAAATLSAPIFFAAAIMLTPQDDRGFWKEPLDLLPAIPAIWLFAAIVSMPTSLVFGPIILAVADRLPPRRTVSAQVLGGLLGAAIMNALPLVVGGATVGFLFQLSAFAAATGAVGAGVAAHWWRRTGLFEGATNAA